MRKIASICVLFVLATRLVLAEENSLQFSYSGAETAFAAGTAPQQAQMDGRWTEIAMAVLPEALEANDLNTYGAIGYHPDGLFTFPNEKGLSIWYLQIQSIKDVFGTLKTSIQKIRVGNESQKILTSGNTREASFSNTAMTFVNPFNSTFITECRLSVMANGTSILLCSDALRDDSDISGPYFRYIGKKTNYRAYVR